MSFARVYSRSILGLKTAPVVVEVHLSGGVSRFSIVGLPETIVKESKDRVRSALLNNHFRFPYGRVTVNLAPADVPKEGSAFDLPIALGILAAMRCVPEASLLNCECAGELALSGELRAIRGALPFALGAAEAGRSLIIPADNAAEAALSQRGVLLTAKHLLEVVAHLCGEQPLLPHQAATLSAPSSVHLDLADVQGQTLPKRALAIAAAGGHHLLFVGPPGSGKSMLAARLLGLLPALDESASLEVAALYSLRRQGFDPQYWGVRPYRSPHHTASAAAMVGGGNPPQPGEISLAHQGVLFLDELPEFQRSVLECLREPLENGRITVSRAGQQAEFPARCQLVAAMNPCPCGYFGSQEKACHCTRERVRRYQQQLSGPFRERVDLCVPVPLLKEIAWGESSTESTAWWAPRILAAQANQQQRQGQLNAFLPVARMSTLCQLSVEAELLLRKLVQVYGLSTRSMHRYLRVARTIADLSDSSIIEAEHLSEVTWYRYWDTSANNEKNNL